MERARRWAVEREVAGSKSRQNGDFLSSGPHAACASERAPSGATHPAPSPTYRTFSPQSLRFFICTYLNINARTSTARYEIVDKGGERARSRPLLAQGKRGGSTQSPAHNSLAYNRWVRWPGSLDTIIGWDGRGSCKINNRLIIIVLRSSNSPVRF